MGGVRRDVRERKLRIRSWRRGTREMDLLLGRFADARMAELDDLRLMQFDALLDLGDPDVHDLVFGIEPAGEFAALIADLREYHGFPDAAVDRPEADGVRKGRSQEQE